MKDSKKLIIGFAFLKFLIHFIVVVSGGYGIFRDELYYLACAEHPATGFVDQPPLSTLFLGLITSVFDDSLFVIRLFPALIGTSTVFLVGKITERMGGSLFAITLACLAYIISPINLGFGTFYSMNVYDLFFWSMTYYLIIQLIQTRDKKWWIWIGVVLGLSLLNKLSTIWLGIGLLVGILLTPSRKWLITLWPYYSAAIALLIFSPFIIWNMTHNWAHLEFIDNATSGKYSGLNAWSFISGQFLINSPNNFLIWVTGLGFIFFSNKLKEYRLLGWIFASTFIILVLNGNSKSEYLAASMPILYASGGIALESWKWLGEKLVLKGVIITFLALGLFFIPLAVPLLPQQQFISYSNWLGISKSNDEGHEEKELPQFYADMHGWEEQVAAIAEAYHSLDVDEKKNTYLFGSNYGKAGAIDYYADEYDLPKSIGNHNSYWIWGYRDYDGGTLILLSSNPDGLKELFHSVEKYADYGCSYCMSYEDVLGIYICRDLKKPVEEFWKELKNYH
ncbi:MAG: glycosyltransferase family 39 protein [Bacteroidota bacterium]